MHVKPVGNASMALLRRSPICPRAGFPPNRRLAQISLIACRSYSNGIDNHLHHDGSNTQLDFVPEIAIVGGGLSGLASAYYAAKGLPKGTKITLYESSDRLGGWIRTDRIKVDVGGKSGVVSFERGPRTLSSLKGSRWRFDDYVLYDLAVDLGLPVTFPEDKPRYICYQDRLVNVSGSLGPDSILWSPLRNKLIMPILNFLKNKYNYFNPEVEALPPGGHVQPPDVPDRSVGEWMREMSGSDVLNETMVSAMLHGIYGGDVWKLSASVVLEQLFRNTLRPTHKDDARVVINQYNIKNNLERDPSIRELIKADKGSLITFGHHGLDTLPRAMEDALRSDPNVTIQLGHKVKSLSYNPKTKKALLSTSKNPSPKAFDKVIYTLPGEHLSEMTSGQLSCASDMHSVTIMTVNLWYPQENLNPEGFGYLIPRAVHNPEHALGVFFDSSVVERGPDEPAGTKLFVLMGGHYYDRPETKIPTDNEAIQQAKAVLERHMGIPADTPCFAMANLAQDCIPQAQVAHRYLLGALDEQVQEHFEKSLTLVGGSFGDIGAMGALGSAWSAMNKLAIEPTWGYTGLNSEFRYMIVPKPNVERPRKHPNEKK